MGDIGSRIGNVMGSRWNFLPLLLLLIICLVFFIDSAGFDIVHFKKGKSISYYVFFWFLAFLPLVLFFFSGYWRESHFHEKILLFALGGLFLAIGYKQNIAYQFSVVFAASVFIYLLRERKVYRPDIFHILLWVYVLVNTVSLFWTTNLEAGIGYLVSFSPLLYIPLLFCFFKLEGKQWDLVALFVFRAMMFYITYSLCSWMLEMRFLQIGFYEGLTLGKSLEIGLYPYDAAYAWTNQTHPTYNAAYVIFALSVGWFYVNRRNVRDGVSHFELIFFVLGTLLLAILTASRFMLIVWLLVNFCGIIFYIRKRRKLLFAVCALSFSLGGGSVVVFSDDILHFVEDPVRSSLHFAAKDAIDDHTWKGVGLGGMRDYFEENRSRFQSIDFNPKEPFPHYHPHNQFMGDLMQTGVLGLTVILAIVLVLCYKAIVRRDWLLGVNVLTYVFLMCVEMPLMYSSGIFFFGLVFCFLIYRKSEKGIRTSTVFYH